PPALHLDLLRQRPARRSLPGRRSRRRPALQQLLRRDEVSGGTGSSETHTNTVNDLSTVGDRRRQQERRDTEIRRSVLRAAVDSAPAANCDSAGCRTDKEI